MAESTKIEWADDTFNPWVGCAKVSPGCANCYAEGWAKRWGRVVWGVGQERKRTSDANWRAVRRWNEEAALGADHWSQAGPEDAPYPGRRVFCASLADWLDDEVPAGWLADLLGLVAGTPFLTWMLLTKRPQNWRARIEAARDHAAGSSPHTGLPALASQMLSPWLEGVAPANVWVGTTTEDQARADLRAPALLAIPAWVRFLSCEPLLGPVDLWRAGAFNATRAYQNIHWVIAGGESGPGARPMHPDWARGLREQSIAAGVAFHFKQWGEHNEHGKREGKARAGRVLDGRTWDELPQGVR